MSQSLRVTRDGPVWTIRLDRPDARNAVDPRTARQLAETWQIFDRDRDSRVAVLTGAGSAFCAGGDLRELDDFDEIVGLLEGALIGPALITKPVVAAVNGPCIGGGLSMLLACDIRIASARAVFSSQAARMGFYPFGQVNALSQEIGTAAAAELMLTARRFDAQEALRLGLIGEVTPAEGLLERAMEVARTVAANAPMTVAAIKRTYATTRYQQLATERDAALSVMASEDAQEGARAFLQGRTPAFTGR